MLISPAIIALTLASLMVAGFTLYAAGLGMRILMQWDATSAAEKQLELESKTYLVSSILSHMLIIELLSLFLFIAVANRLHIFFTGAMCAAGVLNAGAYGYATLVLKTASFVACGVWMVINHVDTRAQDYPLIRFKYAFLLGICLLLMAETVMQTRYLLSLDPQIITSCCGTLFNERILKVASGMTHLPVVTAAEIFYAGMLLTLAAGIRCVLTGRHDWLYGLLSVAVFPLSLAALISYFSLYVYEMPMHHCPFCMLQKEYHFVGYFLYLFLLVGAITGASAGIIGRFRKKASLAALIPKIQKRLCGVSVLGYGLFTLRVTYAIVFSDFKLTGY
ncbi:MAG: hypothetical protein OES70_07390 [Desulfobacterales bacterium]|nr:hypothetical protein [Desulfobacterales bacterium]